MFTYYNERAYCKLNFLFKGHIILAIMCLLKDASTFKIVRFIIEVNCMWVRDLTAPMHLGLLKRALCAPYQNHRSPVALPKLQTVPKLILLISSGSRKKEPRCVCLSEARASHSQRMWAEVSSFTPHPLHSGLSISPSR